MYGRGPEGAVEASAGEGGVAVAGVAEQGGLRHQALQRCHAFAIQCLGFLWMLAAGERAPASAVEASLLHRARHRLTGLGAEEALLGVFQRYGAKLHFRNTLKVGGGAQR